jgi:hypothetical protein
MIEVDLLGYMRKSNQDPLFQLGKTIECLCLDDAIRQIVRLEIVGYRFEYNFYEDMNGHMRIDIKSIYIREDLA